jgi:hypothetical protein
LEHVEDFQESTKCIAVDFPDDRKQRMDAMVAAIQGAFAKQVPLYAKTKELSKWIKMPSFNLVMDHSAEWKKKLDAEMKSNAQALGIPLKRVQHGVKVFDKNGADVTAHLFSAEVQQFPEDVFPLSIQFTKALLPNKEDLLEPLLCLAESSKEKTDHACERLAEASNNLIPDIVNCPRKFAIFFVVPPLVVLLIVNVVSVVMSPFAADAAETALDDTERTAKELKESGAVLVSMVVQLSLAVVASLDSTQKRVHKAFHKRIMSRVCDKFQREVDEIMGVLKSGLDQAVKAFWTALHKVLSLVKIILQLKAAAGRRRRFREGPSCEGSHDRRGASSRSQTILRPSCQSYVAVQEDRSCTSTWPWSAMRETFCQWDNLLPCRWV